MKLNGKMENKTIFIKRYPSKGELPKESGNYTTNIGELKYYCGSLDWSVVNKTSFDGSDDRLPQYWLQEIELPSEEEINFNVDYLAEVNDVASEAFKIGVNFILNKLKGE